MAHQYIITRGIKREVDRYIRELRSQYYPYEFNKDLAKTNPEQKQFVQLAVRPIQLWEVVFPEHMTDIALRTISAKSWDHRIGPTSGKDPKINYKQNKRIKKNYRGLKYVRAGIRTMLGLEDTPYWAETGQRGMVNMQNVEVIDIGFKKDEFMDLKTKKVNKENKKTKADDVELL